MNAGTAAGGPAADGPAPERPAGGGPSGGGTRHRAGGYAPVFGLLALLCALIPVIGDMVAVPAAVLAIVCGVIGVGHYDAGRAPRLLPSVLGATLGAIALLVVVVSFIATSPLG